MLADLDDLDAVFDCEAEDVGDNDGTRDFLKAREFVSDEGADADVLKADGVHHAGGSLDDARTGIAGHGLARESFDYEGADAIERDDLFELDAVAEGAAGPYDR